MAQARPPSLQDGLSSRLWRARLLTPNQFCADCNSADIVAASTTFGIFLCQQCADAHRSLGSDVSKVVTFNETWTPAMVQTMERMGNAASNRSYEQTLPPDTVRPSANSPTSVRKQFIHNKYVRCLFVATNGTRDKVSFADLDGPDLDDINKMNRARGQTQAASLSQSMPVRLVDYFGVVTIGQPTDQKWGHELSGTVLDVAFEPLIVDRYPREDYRDAPLPPNIGMFAFPAQIRLREFQPPPILYPFVLTKVNGAKQYGVCLQFYERISAMDVVRLTATMDQHQSRRLGKQHSRKPTAAAQEDPDSKDTFDPDKMLSPTHSRDRSNAFSDARTKVYEMDLYAPKCLFILSHWPFFSLFSDFLKMLYRTSLSAAPLPLERFISNFVHEVPVPPSGKVRVVFTFADQIFSISRPPPNKLPLCDIPFRPLFAQLQPNLVILLVVAMACEHKIVLCSRSWANLVHIAEALCSLLFPFYWQGVYMPLLPKKLSDFLYAPVPFIAGIHTDYLDSIDKPDGVVFVDVDENKIELPSADMIPALPEKARAKLLKCIKENADIFTGTGTRALPRNSVSTPADADLAFPGSTHVPTVNNFSIQGGIQIPETSAAPAHFTYQSSSTSSHSTLPSSSPHPSSLTPSPPMPNGAPSHSPSSSPTSLSESPSVSGQLYPEKIRDGFLRFWISALRSYRKYFFPPRRSTDRGSEDSDVSQTSKLRDSDMFDTESFIRESPEEWKPLLKAIVQTQLFSFFINERYNAPTELSHQHSALTTGTTALTVPLPSSRSGSFTVANTPAEVRFFDECVLAKENRSAFRVQKFKTPFLDDTSHDVSSSFLAPPPDTSGLRVGARYHYEVFPQLHDALFVSPRFVKPLIEESPLQRIQMTSMMRKVTNVLLVSGNPSRKDWRHTLEAVTKIQAFVRGCRCRRQYRVLRRAAAYLASRLHARIVTEQAVRDFEATRDGIRVIQAAVRASNGRGKLIGSLLGVEAIQSFIRTSQSLSQLKTRRTSVIRVQRWWRRMLPRLSARRRLIARIRAAQTIQSVIRSSLQQNQARHAITMTTCLQAAMRTASAQKFLARKRQAVIWMANRLRMLQQRQHYLNTVRRVTRVQAVIRGRMARLQLKRDLQIKFNALRAEIVVLWSKLHVRLLYRTAFWLVFEKTSFLHLAIHQQEIERLRALHAARRNSLDSKDTPSASRVAAFRALTQEKDALYKVLKFATADATKIKIFEEFKIAKNSKKRKQRLLSELWVDSTLDAEMADEIEAVVEERKSEINLHAGIDPFEIQTRSARAVCVILKASWDRVSIESLQSSSVSTPQDDHSIIVQFHAALASMHHIRTTRIASDLRSIISVTLSAIHSSNARRAVLLRGSSRIYDAAIPPLGLAGSPLLTALPLPVPPRSNQLSLAQNQ